MKKLAVLSVVALSLGHLYAADPQPDATPQAPEAGKPLPPVDSDQTAGPRHKKFDWRADRKDMPQRGQDRRNFAHGPGAQGRPGQGHGGPGGRGGQDHPKMGQGQMLAQALDLTDDQKAKAKAIMDATRPKIMAVREEGREKIKAVMADALQQLRPILTPEQQAVLDDLQKLRADRAALKPAPKFDTSSKTGDAPAN